MRRWLVAGALLALGQVAHAHHVASDSGITPAKPRTIVEVGGDGGALAQGIARGSYLRTSPAIEVGLGRFSLRGQASFVTLERDGFGRNTGPGDAEFAAKATVWASPHGGGLLSLGLGGKAPTGDHTLGLGGGHWGLAPFAAASYERESDAVTLVAATMVIHQIALGDEAHGHGLLVEPHSPQELTASGTLAAVTRDAWGALGSTTSIGVDPGDGWKWTSARMTLGWLATDRLRAIASVEAPVAGDPGWRWRTALALAYVR